MHRLRCCNVLQCAVPFFLRSIYYVYMFIYIYICVYIYVYMYIYIRHTQTHTHTNTRVYECVYPPPQVLQHTTTHCNALQHTATSTISRILDVR